MVAKCLLVTIIGRISLTVILSTLNHSVILNENVHYKFIDAVLTSGCVCPGDTLSYECTVTGASTTIWRGSAFNCYRYNEIVLLHSRFDTGTYGTCNNGAIVARGLSIEGNNYTSQLNVSVTPNTVGKTIECGSDNGLRINRLFTLTIPIITGLSLATSCLCLITDTDHNRATLATQYSRNQ